MIRYGHSYKALFLLVLKFRLYLLVLLRFFYNCFEIMCTQTFCSYYLLLHLHIIHYKDLNKKVYDVFIISPEVGSYKYK